MSCGPASSTIPLSATGRVNVSSPVAALPWTQIAAGLLAGAIFCLDAFTPQALAVAALYVLVLLTAALGDGANRRRRILSWSVACLGLTLVGYGVFEARGAPPLALAHLAISVTVLTATTFLLLRASRMDTAARLGERRYRSIFDSLAVAIWEHDFTPVVDEIRRLRACGVRDLQAFIEENPQFVVAMRRLVRITDVNATALKMMGVLSKGEFFSHLRGFLPETDESFAECILALDERRPLFQAETSILTRGGEPRRIIVAFGLGPDALLDRVPGSILDITGRKTLEAQVARARADLAEAQRNGALAAMSASIAHELHQPMSAIQSYADAACRWMGRAHPDVQEATAALAGLTQAVGHARTVMHRVRSLVGNAPIAFAEIDLAELLSTTVALMERDAREAGARIALEAVTDGLLLIKGDRILLKQLFVNLLTNAIQAMEGVPAPRRLVTLRARRCGERLVVEVEDRGSGWESDAEAKVFGSFYTTKAQGMGLGLSISRTSVERHGGSIELRPGRDGGALVEVSLPLAPARPAAIGRLDGGLQEVAVQGLLQ
jgi:signal transduction histidine kinase